jgi:predicted nucleic acid-binding protein
MNAVDTNVWIYSHDARDRRKQALALETLAAARPMVLPWQVGCEFIAASRKLLSQGFSADEAWDSLNDAVEASSRIALPAAADWPAARELQTREMLGFWDALLVATCLRHGVTTLYTEDFGSPRTIGTVNVINPFA